MPLNKSVDLHLVYPFLTSPLTRQDAPSMNYCLLRISREFQWDKTLHSSSSIKEAISKKQLLVSTCACVIVEMASHHYASSACAAILFLSTTFGNSFFTNNRQISGHILESIVLKKKGLFFINIEMGIFRWLDAIRSKVRPGFMNPSSILSNDKNLSYPDLIIWGRWHPSAIY